MKTRNSAIDDKPPDAAALWLDLPTFHSLTKGQHRQATYWRDFPNFTYPSPIFTRVIGFIFGTEKLEWLGYNLVKDRMMIDPVIWAQYINVCVGHTGVGRQKVLNVNANLDIYQIIMPCFFSIGIPSQLCRPDQINFVTLTRGSACDCWRRNSSFSVSK